MAVSHFLSSQTLEKSKRFHPVALAYCNIWLPIQGIIFFSSGNYNWSLRIYFLCNERNSFSWGILSFWTGKWHTTYPKPDILHTLTHSYWFLWKYIKNWQLLSSKRINKISNRYLPQFLVIYDLLLFVKSQGTLLNCKSHGKHYFIYDNSVFTISSTIIFNILNY